MHAPEPAEPTRRAGPYRLGRRLGAGGMGAVFEGVHERTGARYAVKLLAGRSQEDLARFRREAALTARLEHPGVVRVHDLGLERPPYYIAMDLVEGGSLQARLDREGALPVAVALDVAARLAAALWHAHARGVIHRDLKPANILLDAAGAPRLVDFGLARDGGADLERLTLTGEIVGTPRYIAPEQVLDSRAVDGRADVYALGGVLFAMVTGEPPMPGDDVAQVFRAVRTHVPPPPSSLRPGVPPAVDAICARALAKTPAERFSSAAELLEALEAARRAPAASDAPHPGARPRRVLALAVAALLAAAAGVVAVATARGPTSAPVEPRPAEPAPVEPAPVAVTAPPATPALALATDREAPIHTPWTLSALDGRHHALSVTFGDEAGVTDTVTLLLGGRSREVSGDRAAVALRIEQVLAWSGDEVERVDAPSPTTRLARLIGGELVVALALSNGDVVGVEVDEGLAAAAARLDGRDDLLRALLRPDGVEAVLAAAARATPPAREGAAPMEGALVPVTEAARRPFALRLEPIEVRTPAAPGVEALHAILPGLRDAASLWLHNGLPPLGRSSAPRPLLVPGSIPFGGPAELVAAARPVVPVFAAPWGPVVAALREGQVLGAHERRGEWRRVCVEGGSGWVLDRGALGRAPGDLQAVVVLDRQAYAYPNPERRSGTAVGIAPPGAVFVVRGRTAGVGKGPHLEVDYGGVRCWLLEGDTRPLRP